MEFRRVLFRSLADAALAPKAFLLDEVVAIPPALFELGERGQGLERELYHAHFGCEFGRNRRIGLPKYGQRSARFDDALVLEERAGTLHGRQRGEDRKTEAAAVTIGDGGVGGVLLRGGKLAAGALQEEARGAARLRLDDLAHRADVVGGNQLVLPGERRRMAGVVDDRRHHSTRIIAHAADEEGVIGRL